MGRASPARGIRLIRPPQADGAGLLEVTQGKKTTYYALKEVPCEVGGRGFAVYRLGLSALYHVRVGRPEDCSCECLGFLRHGRCRHLLALQTLIAQGLI